MASHTHTTVIGEEEWHQLGDAWAHVLEDQQVEWVGQMDEDDELAMGWANPSSVSYSSITEELPTHEGHGTLGGLDGAYEESWQDISCVLYPDYVAPFDDTGILQDSPSCESTAAVVTSHAQLDLLSDGEIVDETTQYDGIEQLDVVDMLLRGDSLCSINDSFINNQVITVDDSQLKALLSGCTSTETESTFRNDAASASSNDVDELDSSHSDSDENGSDSDWSYSGKRKRRRSSASCRQVRRKSFHLSARSRGDDRKKQQNKDAATRYRERKRAEERNNEAECAALEKRNKELRARVQELSHEVAVVRKLVVDIYRR